MENKNEIIKALLPVLQMTRNLSDLQNLEYFKVERNGCEYEHVIATFESGFKKTVDVAMDSGTAMIVDVLKQIL